MLMQHGRQFILKGFRVAISDPQVRNLLGLTLSIIGIASIAYHYIEGWRWIDAVYFSVITIATVGYGDFSPQTDVGKLFTIFYIFTGLGLFVATATAFADSMINGRSQNMSRSDRDEGEA